MDRRTTILPALLGLSLTAVIGAMAACAEAPPAEIAIQQQPAEPEATTKESSPLPPSNPVKIEDAGKDVAEKKDSAPPPPPPPPGGDNETCPAGDQTYMTKALVLQLSGGLTPCPCSAGECCVENELFPGFVQKMGCVEK